MRPKFLFFKPKKWSPVTTFACFMVAPIGLVLILVSWILWIGEGGVEMSGALKDFLDGPDSREKSLLLGYLSL